MARVTGAAEWDAWYEMKRRCYSPHVRPYRNYGGRGIKVCDRWLGPDGFENFMEDMGSRPSSSHSLDRKDNNGNYTPENCRWATPVEQQNNLRTNTVIEFAGKRMTAAQWERELGLRTGIITKRLSQQGWSVERALTVPPRPKRPNGCGPVGLRRARAQAEAVG